MSVVMNVTSVAVLLIVETAGETGDDSKQFVTIDGFHHMSVVSGNDRPHSIFDTSVTGQRYRRNAMAHSVSLSYSLDQLATVHSRHYDVGNKNIELFFAQFDKCLFSARDGADAGATLSQLDIDQVQGVRFIVNHQNVQTL